VDLGAALLLAALLPVRWAGTAADVGVVREPLAAR
jgi:hypothetical protein